MNHSVLHNALDLRRADNLAEAALPYPEFLKNNPRDFEGLHALGILHYQSSGIEQPKRLIGDALRIFKLDASHD